MEEKVAEKILLAKVTLRTSDHLKINGLADDLRNVADKIAMKMEGEKASMDTVITVNGSDTSVKKDTKGLSKEQLKKYNKVHDEAVEIASASRKKSTIRIKIEIE